MRFNPKEVNNLLAEDIGTFKVIEGKDCISKAGNEQMKLTMQGSDKNGKQGLITYYVCYPWQLKKLCEAANRMDLFETGDVTARSVVGFSGQCIFKTEIDETGTYDDKTIISKFIKYTGAQTANKAIITNSTQERAVYGSDNTHVVPFDDEIPF